MDANVPRRVIEIPCEGAILVATLDEADRSTGLLVVSGGNEIRIGAHRGMAWLAAEIAGTGFPVMRYDRRGVGDSSGENRGFENAGPDLASAIAAFHAHGARRIVAFGNCDAATLLMMRHKGVDALILANPWVVEQTDDLPPAAAIRARYADRLRDPAEWARLARGGVDLGKLARGVGKLVGARDGHALAARAAAGLGGFEGAITILLAERDATAVAFADVWRGKAFAAARQRARVERLSSASHSFASAEDKLWMREQVLAALAKA